MSNYSKFLHLLNGVARTVDLSTNTLETAGLQLDGSSSGHLLQSASATTTSYSLIWPSAQGSANSFLQNDGSGNLSWTQITSTPSIANTFVAGQTFAANTSYVVRWGMNALSETTSRIYAADYSTVSYDEFWAIGIAFSASGVTAGQNITVYSFGSYTLGSSDTPFSSANVGDPFWLTSAGGFSAIAPTGNSEADLKVGIIISTTQVWLDGQMMGVGNVPTGAGPNPLTVAEGGTGVTSFTPYAVIAGGATSTDPLQQVSGLGTSGYVLTSNGSGALPSWQAAASPVTYSDSIVNTAGVVTLVNDSASPGNTKYYGTNGSGTLGYYSIPATGVSSVALSDGSSTPIYSISGSPVTSSGTLTFTLQNQSANTVFAGPSSGSAAQPGFRSLVANDIPTLPYLSTTLGTANGLSVSTNTLSLGTASTSTTGALTSTDWNTFNNKQASGNYITALTGDVTSSGPGSAAATIASGAVTASKLGTVTDGITLDQSGSGSTLEIKSGGVGTTQLAANGVTNAKLAQMGANTIKGNNTGSTANASDLSVANVLTMLGIFSGKTSISNGATTVSVTFSTAYASTGYSVTCNMINTTDSHPSFQPVVITAQSTTGFTATWNVGVPTTNYSLSWQAVLSN